MKQSRYMIFAFYSFLGFAPKKRLKVYVYMRYAPEKVLVQWHLSVHDVTSNRKLFFQTQSADYQS